MIEKLFLHDFTVGNRRACTQHRPRKEFGVERNVWVRLHFCSYALPPLESVRPRSHPEWTVTIQEFFNARIYEAIDLENDVVLDEGRDIGFRHRRPDEIQYVFNPAARICQELIIFVQPFAQCGKTGTVPG